MQGGTLALGRRAPAGTAGWSLTPYFLDSSALVKRYIDLLSRLARLDIRVQPPHPLTLVAPDI